MQQTFDITRTSRQILSQFLEKNTLEQLNAIPEGFSNNLIWNIAHIIVVQQMLVYKLSGLPMNISDEMVEKYKKGARPEHKVSQDEVDKIKSLLTETIDQTETDFANKTFQNYQEYPTSTGFSIKNVEDAMAFSCFHEGIHIGFMMGIRKFI
ncbi:DinB family protein [uncultured Flavobacterium sp.]|jgi:hypothetical protein|uniref:DinB family protein n=1 Tax=uncultured Flavobacterium sp. TaxID=165435 RepID=UPI0030CA4B08